jgi:hypothetical protein
MFVGLEFSGPLTPSPRVLQLRSQHSPTIPLSGRPECSRITPWPATVLPRTTSGGSIAQLSASMASGGFSTHSRPGRGLPNTKCPFAARQAAVEPSCSVRLDLASLASCATRPPLLSNPRQFEATLAVGTRPFDVEGEPPLVPQSKRLLLPGPVVAPGTLRSSPAGAVKLVTTTNPRRERKAAAKMTLNDIMEAFDQRLRRGGKLTRLAGALAFADSGCARERRYVQNCRRAPEARFASWSLSLDAHDLR